MEKIVFIVILLAVFGLVFYLLFMQDRDFLGDVASIPVKGADTKSGATVPFPPADNSGEKGNAVIYTDSGYVPKSITVKAGEEIKFVNRSDGNFWPASALHPTHRVYPGSGIEKCFGPEVSKIFDACNEMPQGSEWSFRFNEHGTWRYHDHLHPAHTGTVVVE